MNNLIQLKGQLEHSSNTTRAGGRSLPRNTSVKAEHLDQLLLDLHRIYEFWSQNTLIKGALVSVYYNSVIAKSNRIRRMLAAEGKDPNDSIRGAKFYGESPRHVFTHYIKLNNIETTISNLSNVLDILRNNFHGEITDTDLNSITDKKTFFAYKKISKTNFINYIVDAHYVQRFDVATYDENVSVPSIVTLYKTDVPTNVLLRSIGIDVINAKTIDDTTILLTPAELALLKSKAPYLIAMAVHDLREIPSENIISSCSNIIQIPDPKQEPVIGVIDTPFDTGVYFAKWVTYFNMIDNNIEIEPRDYEHGTEVSSIIVDGPTINPDLNDGCGRFRVKHFGVAKRGSFSSFTILKAIRLIVSQNTEIKVWNLSLGSILPISKNFISPEAAELDRIQSEYDVIFVIAGTNKNTNSDAPLRFPIGAPADSLNSLVVNSVKKNHEPASYHRVGPVLSFFHKPDVSYYGGDTKEPIRVCAPLGESFVCGTSFSAPWISRKMAYLICKLGFSREVAKALIIDAAAGWNRQDDVSCAIGYGVVPKRIENIVKSEDDEIKFTIMGTADSYETYSYNIPVPIVNEKQPFFARATLCYFPKCIRSQGVDYTSTEMDIHFGRVSDNNGRPKIDSINSNVQGDKELISLYEPDARRLFRKWDNVKLISDTIHPNSRPRKKKSELGLWGISIKTKERLKEKYGRGLSFGVVITLKEMNGINRIDDFIKMCTIRGWIATPINIENQLDIYSKGQEDVKF